ncbi:MAG TPA: penicillin-binding protein [Salinimicrobium sp.]|nr:penicillin-binding protein [Salinimicrobium sp.]
MAAEEKNILKRLYLITGLLFLIAIGVGFKLLNIQFVEGEKYKALAEERTFRNFTITANRGNLYDANGNLLATSVPKYDIRFDAVTVSEENFQENLVPLSKELSLMFGQSTEYYVSKIKSARKNGDRYIRIADNLGYSEYKKVSNFPMFSLGAFKGGLIVEQRTVREHPLGGIAERTVGYERKTENGKYIPVGLEGAYGEYLRGKDGKRLKQKIAKGQWKPISDNNEIEPKDGYDVVSTIDVNIQDIAHHALLAQLQKYEAEHGTVVVMETKTGEIKAIANLGRTSKGKYFEKLNYAVGESHEPGSTFKLMALVAALEDKVVDTSDVFDTQNGKIKFYDRTVYDSHRGGFGKISIAEAFKLSSNTAFALLVNENYKNDPEKFVNRLYNMGLNEKLGLEIKGEGKPKIPHPKDKNWYGTTLPWMAFGYGVHLTPLQTLAFYNAIANNGKMVKPKFIKEVREWGKIIEKIDEPVSYSICSKETAIIAQDLMAQVVSDGTASNIKSPILEMAGKTGTCQVEYWIKSEQNYIASFAGFFPVENPQYSCIVVIHKPNPALGFYGNIVAAPVFKQIAQKIYSDTPVTDEIPVLNPKNEEVLEDFNSYYSISKKYKSVMPNLIGLPAMDAISILENLGLKVKISGNGVVKEQSIEPGKKIGSTKNIYLKLS